MSKAFTREDDAAPGTPLPPPVSSLPPGVKNYLTADGAKRLQSELDRLLTVDRPLLAVRSDDHESRRALQAIDQRIRHLQQSLRSAEVVSPRQDPGEIVHFGAEVIVREKDGTEISYHIVGVDEADPSEHRVSWRSPFAQALLNARVGDRVSFQAPAGRQEFQIVAMK